jgi:hypothetical protein
MVKIILVGRLTAAILTIVQLKEWRKGLIHDDKILHHHIENG